MSVFLERGTRYCPAPASQEASSSCTSVFEPERVSSPHPPENSTNRASIFVFFSYRSNVAVLVVVVSSLGVVSSF